jgi:hypothetical protein
MFMKKFIPIFVSLGLLAGCGGLKEGDSFTLKDTVYGASTINDWNEAVEESNEDGTFDTDGVTVNSLIEDYKVKVVEISKKDKMVLVQLMEGSDEGTKWWVPQVDLEAATE